MAEPRIIPRAEHTLSRRDVDPDALRVLYRLRQSGQLAYLVGGSVRDLLIGRRPKDFDIGTSAHPYQVKKLFRNCWVIGRRFRLAHVKFGQKVIEVATFRRQVAPGEEATQDAVPAPIHEPAAEQLDEQTGARPAQVDHLIHRDNTFGTPEEDAFRRDFTINALFYDIATFSVIDYVGGLEDLRRGLVRSIGDPDVRFREDPVRMMRAVALSARLDFRIDEPILAAIQANRGELARSSPARLLDEYYKILRGGSAERTFRALARLGLLEPVSSELQQGAGEPLWQSLAALDAYRRRFETVPDTLTNAILLGTLLIPLDLLPTGGWRGPARRQPEGEGAGPVGPRLGALPLARRDIERLSQVLALQRRLRDLTASPRARYALAQRAVFQDALTWFDVRAEAPEVVEQWKGLVTAEAPTPVVDGQNPGAPGPGPRRRRRRRRRFRPVPQ